MRYLLDTNIVSAICDNERLLLQRISEVEYYLSSIVIGELYQGAFLSPDKAVLLTHIRELSSRVRVLSADERCGEHYGRIVADLQPIGVTLPINDLWIAAQAKRYNLTLVTRDARFQHIQGLKLVQW
jgi:tRNA(fMet)-specific endonuclease VapC